MNRTVYLVRHAESAMNVQPHLIGGRSNEAELTDRGVAQARSLGRGLLSLAPFAAVYASPAIRTLHTARYAFDVFAEPPFVTVDGDLQEMDQGDAVGHERSVVYTPAVLASIESEGKDFALPGGESMNDVGTRMKDWLVRHQHEADDGPLLVFGHGLAIRCLASTLGNWTRARTYEAVTPNASITTFTDDGDGWRLRELGRLIGATE